MPRLMLNLEEKIRYVDLMWPLFLNLYCPGEPTCLHSSLFLRCFKKKRVQFCFNLKDNIVSMIFLKLVEGHSNLKEGAYIFMYVVLPIARIQLTLYPCQVNNTQTKYINFAKVAQHKRSINPYRFLRFTP